MVRLTRQSLGQSIDEVVAVQFRAQVQVEGVVLFVPTAAFAARRGQELTQPRSSLWEKSTNGLYSNAVRDATHAPISRIFIHTKRIHKVALSWPMEVDHVTRNEILVKCAKLKHEKRMERRKEEANWG